VWGFEECAQKPNVRFNIQPTTQPTGFSDLQLIEASSSNQSTEVLSKIFIVFPHESKPSTSVTKRASTGGRVKAAILYPFPSILKKSTSDARSSGPGSA
jgi:ERCC4-type nuclease